MPRPNLNRASFGEGGGGGGGGGNMKFSLKWIVQLSSILPNL